MCALAITTCCTTSTVDNVANPSLFVTFHDAQACKFLRLPCASNLGQQAIETSHSHPNLVHLAALLFLPFLKPSHLTTFPYLSPTPRAQTLNT